MGLSAAIPVLPRGYNYSVMFAAAPGGTTAGVYAWGALIREYHGTVRLPSVTLTHVGYYTDDGAYYYVWDNYGLPPRPWPAEKGLVLVKEALQVGPYSACHEETDPDRFLFHLLLIAILGARFLRFGAVASPFSVGLGGCRGQARLLDHGGERIQMPKFSQLGQG